MQGRFAVWDVLTAACYAAQLALAADNLEAVLATAGMTLADAGRLNIYTTGIDTLLQHFPVLTGRFEGTGERFASTLPGVARLAGPELLVALEATAMD